MSTPEERIQKKYIPEIASLEKQVELLRDAVELMSDAASGTLESIKANDTKEAMRKLEYYKTYAHTKLMEAIALKKSPI